MCSNFLILVCLDIYNFSPADRIPSAAAVWRDTFIKFWLLSLKVASLLTLLFPHLPAFAVSLASFLSHLLGKDLSYKRLATYTNLYKKCCLLAIFSTQVGCTFILNRNILKSNRSYKAVVIPRVVVSCTRESREPKQYWIISVTGHSLLLLSLFRVNLYAAAPELLRRVRKICL